MHSRKRFKTLLLKVNMFLERFLRKISRILLLHKHRLWVLKKIPTIGILVTKEATPCKNPAILEHIRNGLYGKSCPRCAHEPNNNLLIKTCISARGRCTLAHWRYSALLLKTGYRNIIKWTIIRIDSTELV